MYLYSLKIKGFKRHKETEVLFSDASFFDWRKQCRKK